ncbi:MAG: phage tail tape measure protein [Elusimicrobiota bacterium]|jgi:TP901 family phage tail tape measure protein|nr:phage tail tape measure protein [Elusimicrobiota bacterium]
MAEYSLSMQFKAIQDITEKLEKMSKSVTKFSDDVNKKFTDLNKTSTNLSDTVEQMEGNITIFSKDIKDQFLDFGNAVGIADKKMEEFQNQSMKTSSILKSGFMLGLGNWVANKAINQLALIPQKTIGFIKDSVKVGMEFESVLVSAVSKLSDDYDRPLKKTSAEFQLLRDAARKVGIETRFSAIEGAKALEFIAQAGFDAKQSVAILPKVINLALASNTDFAQSSMIATKTLGMFNMKVADTIQLQKNLERISDVMAKAANITNAEVVDIFETYQQVGAISTSLNTNIETVTAMIGSISNVAVRQQAGTYLKAVFTNIVDVNKQVKLLEKGIKVLDKKGDLLDVLDIIEQIKKKTLKMGTGERAGFLSDIFGDRGLIAISTFVNQDIEAIKNMRNELLAAGGSVKEMADILDDTMQGDIYKLNAALNDTKITISDIAQTQGLREMVQEITKAILQLDRFLKEHQEIGNFLGKMGKFVLDRTKANIDFVPSLFGKSGIFNRIYNDAVPILDYGNYMSRYGSLDIGQLPIEQPRIDETPMIKEYKEQKNILEKQNIENLLNINFSNIPDNVQIESDIKTPAITLNAGKRNK